MFFTIKCFSDTRSTESGDIERGYIARTYRAVHLQGAVKIEIETPDGCDVEILVDGSLGNYDRAYVENPMGKTVSKFVPPIIKSGETGGGLKRGAQLADAL